MKILGENTVAMGHDIGLNKKLLDLILKTLVTKAKNTQIGFGPTN